MFNNIYTQKNQNTNILAYKDNNFVTVYKQVFVLIRF